MLNFLKKIFRRQFFLKVLFILLGIIWLVNLPKDSSFLIGWDSLQTELSPLLGIQRSFFSVWQEYQSFGLTAGMAHAADLPRAIFIAILTQITPLHLVRFVFHLLMLSVGTISSYFFYKRVITTPKSGDVFSFLGALFYLTSFYTIQIFSLPFETFSIFYAFLPLSILFLDQYLRHQTRSSYLKLVCINIFILSSFVSQQLFLVYLMIISTWIVFGPYKKNRDYFVACIYAIFGILALNLHWILPQIYFLATNGKIVFENKMNSIATESILFQNESLTWLDFIRSNSFFSKLTGVNNQPLFGIWNTFRAHFLTNIILLLISAISFLGLIFSKGRYKMVMRIFLFALVILLIPNLLVLSEVVDFFRKNEFLSQIFRSPFTKFFALYLLVTAYFFSNGVLSIYNFVQKFSTSVLSKLLNIILLLFVTTGLCYASFPLFTGHLFSSQMKQNIPPSVISTLEFFEKVPTSKRIGLLPESTFWGWTFQESGYNGSGYIWYGLKQPVISRTFDVWSEYSESYFWQLRDSMITHSQVNFQNTLSKFGVDYLIFDESLLPVISSPKSIDLKGVTKMLNECAICHLEAKYDQITIYRISRPYKSDEFVLGSNTVPPNISSSIWSPVDVPYQKNGDYLENSGREFDQFYPFSNLISYKTPPDARWIFTEKPNDFEISTQLPKNTPKNISMKVSNPIQEVAIPELSSLKYLSYQVDYSSKNNEIIANFPKIKLASISKDKLKIYGCGPDSKFQIQRNDKDVKIRTLEGKTCMKAEFPSLPLKYGYIMKIRAHKLNRAPYLYLVDDTKEIPYIEQRLTEDTKYLLITPQDTWGNGLTLNLEQTASNNSYSEFAFESVEVFIFPFDSLSKLFVANVDSIPQKNNILFPLKATHNVPHAYTISPNKSAKGFVLMQSYSKNWYAWQFEKSTWANHYFPFLFSGSRLQNHSKYNGWANFWETSMNTNDSTIEVRFPAQYLQFFGYTFGILSLIIIFIFSKKNKSK